MKKIFSLTILIIATYQLSYSQATKMKLKGDKHCPCWTFDPGSCEEPGFVCLDFAIANPNDETADKVELNVNEMTATYSVHKLNYSELEKIISNNKVHNSYESSMIDKDLLISYGYTGPNKVRIKLGDYDYQLVGDYYIFTVDLESGN